MKTIITIIVLVLANNCATAETLGTEQIHNPKESKNTYVLIVSGINKDPNEHLAKDKAVIKLRKFFLKNAGLASNRISVLVDSSSSAGKDAQVSTAENLKKTMNALAATVKPTDKFIFYYVGQANIVANKLRLNLPGKDITHEQLAKWINEIKASSTLIVLDCPGAGLAAKAMAGKKRIVVCSCTSSQHYSTQFSKYFIPALIDNKSDTNNDGKVSLLEAFTSASEQLDNFYRQRYLLKTETPVLEDNGDGLPSQHPWKYKQDNKDGLAASKFFLITELQEVQKI